MTAIRNLPALPADFVNNHIIQQLYQGMNLNSVINTDGACDFLQSCKKSKYSRIQRIDYSTEDLNIGIPEFLSAQ